jgi:hypothetical protein
MSKHTEVLMNFAAIKIKGVRGERSTDKNAGVFKNIFQRYLSDEGGDGRTWNSAP